MPTVFSHPAVPLLLRVGLGGEAAPRRLLLAGVLASALALAGAAAARTLRATFARAFVFLFVAIGSHGVLDALTNGGLGVALLWPASGDRFFAPEALRVIEVSPIGLTPFLSARGVAVLESELWWIWLPALALGLILVGARRARSRRRDGGHS